MPSCWDGWLCAKRLDERRLFAAPKIVKVVPYAFVARVTKVEWLSFASDTATPDVTALLAARRAGTVESSWSEARAVSIARHMSNHQSTLMPFVEQFAELMEKYSDRVPPDALCSWLSAIDPDLRAAQTAFYAERAAINAYCPRPYVDFGARAILGEFASIALSPVSRSSRGVR